MYVSVWNFCLGVADVRPRKTSPAERSKEKWLFLQAMLCTELALENDFDILSISENWFNSSVAIATVEIPGYRIFKLDRFGKTGANICQVCPEGKIPEGSHRNNLVWPTSIVDSRAKQEASLSIGWHY